MGKIAYPIQAVSKLTGLSIDTLRAWERRYEAIKPARNDRGRVYDDADVRRLILLRGAVEGGHPIGKVAVLSNRELEQIKNRSVALSALPSDPAEGHSRRPPLHLDTLHDALRRFDCLAFDQELNRLAATVPPRSLIHDIVTPLMSDIGDQWYRKDLTIAQEHMATGALRNLVGSLVRLYTRRQPASTLVFATPTGEQHEFGILCAAMLAAIGGLGVIYLGADLPSAEIIDATQKTGAAVLVLGVKAAIPGKDRLKELRRISETLPASVEFWVGGVRSADLVREIKTTRARYLSNFDALERELGRSGARF